MESLFEIRVEGQLDAEWADWFEGMTLSPEPDGITVLSGPIADQAALQGLLRRVGDLGMTLISVNNVSALELSAFTRDAPRHPPDESVRPRTRRVR